jgi:hypothetical protein
LLCPNVDWQKQAITPTQNRPGAGSRDEIVVGTGDLHQNRVNECNGDVTPTILKPSVKYLSETGVWEPSPTGPLKGL